MAKKWTLITGQSTSDSAIGRGLKKIGFTYKKTFHYCEADKEKREEYLKVISQIDPRKIVYSDETGIDDNEDIPLGGLPEENDAIQKNVHSELQDIILPPL